MFQARKVIAVSFIGICFVLLNGCEQPKPRIITKHQCHSPSNKYTATFTADVRGSNIWPDVKFYLTISDDLGEEEQKVMIFESGNDIAIEWLDDSSLIITYPEESEIIFWKNTAWFGSHKTDNLRKVRSELRHKAAKNYMFKDNIRGCLS